MANEADIVGIAARPRATAMAPPHRGEEGAARLPRGPRTSRVKAAMQRLIAASASDFNLMNSTKTKREYSSMHDALLFPKLRD